MKYIRTKDKIYDFQKLIDEDNIHWCVDKNGHLYNEINNVEVDIINQADTIEELCDEFVVYDNMNNICIDILGSFKSLKDNGWIHSGFDVYGAIWTNKGLIYVAKENDKGGTRVDMNRLTKKIGDNYCSQAGDFYDLYNKLGKLEDLEEEVGCPLEVLGKVIKNEYVVVEDKKGELIFKLAIIKNEKIWIKWKGKECYLPIEDYKKTWWLKEDKSE